MINRTDIRYACYRAKKNSATEEHKLLLQSEVEPHLKQWQTYDLFATKWDILVTKQGKVEIIKPEIEYDFIHNTCLEASLLAKKDLPFDDFNERQKNLIVIVESMMLEKIMTWKNYSKVWGVEIIREKNTLKTKLYNIKPTQTEVTDEMIQASIKQMIPADAPTLNIKTGDTEITLDHKMSQEEIDKFNEFLKSQKQE